MRYEVSSVAGAWCRGPLAQHDDQGRVRGRSRPFVPLAAPLDVAKSDPCEFTEFLPGSPELR